ncbi:MAG: hypothetical protein EOP21_12660, partial [Hyphomicrobiales bacterium]
MPQSILPKPILLDTADTDSLLSTMHGLDGPGVGHTAHTRLRYLQKIGFPASANAGRGRRTVHDLKALLQLALVFEMLDLGILPARAAATVDTLWPDLGAAFTDAWRALERHRSDAPGVGDTRAEPTAGLQGDAESDRKLIVLSPRALSSTEAEPLAAVTTTLASERGVASGSARGSRARAIVDPYAIVCDLDAALQSALRYRHDEIAAAFE